MVWKLLLWSRCDDLRLLAVGPDGDIWAGEVDVLWGLDAAGRLKEAHPIPQCAIHALAVSPQGIAHFASRTIGCRGIHKMTEAGRERVVADSIGELAFDRMGNLYVGARLESPGDSGGMWGRVLLYDTDYRFVRRLAHVPGLEGGLVFLRDAGGRMTSRLVTVDAARLLQQQLVELAGAGDRPMGFGPALMERVTLTARDGTLERPTGRRRPPGLRQPPRRLTSLR